MATKTTRLAYARVWPYGAGLGMPTAVRVFTDRLARDAALRGCNTEYRGERDYTEPVRWADLSAEERRGARLRRDVWALDYATGELG